MHGLSLLVLLLAALYSAALPYRQRAKLREDVSATASMIALSGIFIALSSATEFYLWLTGQVPETLGTMLFNLQHYLAIPLWCSAIACLCWPKFFSKGSWGRWSLALLAAFELCRRAQVSDHFALTLAALCCAIVITAMLVVRQQITIFSILGSLLLAAALLLFATNVDLAGLANALYYNIALAFALVFISFQASLKLPLEEK
ncbi:MAG: hypothetical protein ACPG4U_15725 [Pseudomonadales bacterium]